MPEERLRETVTELERELESIESMDEGTRRLLEEAVQEIQQTLRQRHQAVASDEVASDPAAAAPTDSSGTLNERLTAAAQDFESSHPTLGGILSRVIDLLGQIGI